MKQLFDANKPHLAVWLWIYDPILPSQTRHRPETPLPLLRTPLHYAAFCGLHTIVKNLADQYPEHVHSRGFDGRSTPLHLASSEGHLEVAKVLVDLGHGTNVIAQSMNWLTPLHEASTVEMARFLTEHGADATARDKFGLTPLHWVVDRENVDVARFLIEHGADVTARDKNGQTPLQYISTLESINMDLAMLLVEHGADVTAQDENGSTPLLDASHCYSGNMEFCAFDVGRYDRGDA